MEGLCRIVALVTIFTVVLAIPPPVPEEFRTKDKPTNNTIPHHVLLFRRAAFRTKWVSHNGAITDYSPGNAIQVDATTSVSTHAHQVAVTIISRMTSLLSGANFARQPATPKLAATIISRMTSLLSGANFARAASNTKVGVFAEAEHLTAYPEYYQYATYQCSEHQCSGSCHATCTFDNRQYYTLAGAGGARAVVSDANILCRDNYKGKSNILAHEYSHSLHRHVLDSAMKARITAAFQNAKRNNIWSDNYAMSNEEEYFAITAAFQNAKRNNIWSDNYAMSNEEEYFAVGVTVYFHTELLTGGGSHSMNQCDHHMCSSEAAARYHMYYTDLSLYGIIYDIFSDKPANLRACMA